MADVVLYDYWRSSASYRVRIALNLAEIPYTAKVIDLLQREHRSPEHLARNPQGLVPALEIDNHLFTQSLAMIEYLDETRALGLLPKDPADRARARALAYAIAIDLHPVCNLSVATHAARITGDESAKVEWMRHFIGPSLEQFEQMLTRFTPAPYCTGSQITVADICLIPQLYNATRWGVDYSHLSRICAIEAACAQLPAFEQARPEAVNHPN